MNPGLVAIVTGASRGIGAATTREFVDAGMRVVATARSADRLEGLAHSLEGASGQVRAVPADACDPAALEHVVNETIEAFGRLDILVNDAGFLHEAHPISDRRTGVWEATMDLNLRAPWLLSTLAYPHMKQAGGGAIVNVTSTAGLQPEVGLGVYGISKAAVVMLTQVCAKEWARDKIRVNAVAPGLTDTEMAVPIQEYLAARGKPLTPLGEMIQPEEVARLIHFLVDGRGRHMTGDVVRLDAGHVL